MVRGNTGVELIDAAMRELKTTGYLSNRLRQVVASFLIYDLELDWRAGAAWFEAQLLITMCIAIQVIGSTSLDAAPIHVVVVVSILRNNSVSTMWIVAIVRCG